MRCSMKVYICVFWNLDLDQNVEHGKGYHWNVRECGRVASDQNELRVMNPIAI